MGVLPFILLLTGAGIGLKILTGSDIEADNKAMLNKIAPKARPFFQKFLIEAKKAGYNLRIVYSFRTFLEQAALYAQGRETLEKVNTLRKAAGMYLLKSDSENYVVTDSEPGESYHNYMLAIDIVDRDKGYKIDYVELRKIAKRVGLEYITGDLPHFHKSFGYSTVELLKALKDGTIETLLAA